MLNFFIISLWSISFDQVEIVAFLRSLPCTEVLGLLFPCCSIFVGVSVTSGGLHACLGITRGFRHTIDDGRVVRVRLFISVWAGLESIPS